MRPVNTRPVLAEQHWRAVASRRAPADSIQRVGWRECLEIIQSLHGTADFDQYRISFVRGLCLFHLGNVKASQEEFHRVGDLGWRLPAVSSSPTQPATDRASHCCSQVASAGPRRTDEEARSGWISSRPMSSSCHFTFRPKIIARRTSRCRRSIFPSITGGHSRIPFAGSGSRRHDEAALENAQDLARGPLAQARYRDRPGCARFPGPWLIEFIQRRGLRAVPLVLSRLGKIADSWVRTFRKPLASTATRLSKISTTNVI